MSVESIKEVVDKIQSQEFWQVLVESRHQHDELDQEIQQLLDQYQDEGKEPNAMAKGMLRIKINAMLMMKLSDQSIDE